MADAGTAVRTALLETAWGSFVHAASRNLDHYTRDADQKGLAKSAVAKLERAKK